ncbi:MAG: ribonuclease HII [Woeseiaceae bacterium]
MRAVLPDCQQVDGLIAGVDEAGRGPLAGPVVAAAVILRADRPIAGLTDSKVLSEMRREALSTEIRRQSLAWSVAWADAAEIDAINILQATFLAMRRALLGLRVAPGLARVDGNRLPNLAFADRCIAGEAIVRGDASVPAISAASILAKVHRDQMMCAMDHHYPDYGFRQHKGYGTAAHRERIGRLGPCPQHRRTFRPVSTLS